MVTWSQLYSKMPDENKSNDEEKNPKKGGEFRVPPRTWIVWIAIFGGIILLMLMKEKFDTPGENIPQWRFMQLFDSNAVTEAKVYYNPQNILLTEIVGKYRLNERSKEIPFRTKARLSEAMEAQLFSDPKFEPKEPNTMLLSVVWSVLPIIVIAALIWFFFIRQIKMAGKGALSFGKSKARL